jgi:hypothetical protein
MMEIKSKNILNLRKLIRETIGGSCEFQYMSDAQRADMIQDALKQDIWDDDEEAYEDDLLDAAWQTIVFNKAQYVDFYELFTDDCWEGMFDKPEYKGLSKSQGITKLMKDRFPVIAKSVGMPTISWSMDDAILNVKFKKQ